MSEIPSQIRAALDAGLNAHALDFARAAQSDPATASDAAEIQYLGALASVRMGALDDAEKWLAEIDREVIGDGPLAVEAWSLAGRIAKERFAATRDPSNAAACGFASEAIAHYGRAFALRADAYPAVNAATMAMLAGDAPRARTFARHALAALGSTADHWHHACAGEALLVLEQFAEARAHYASAYQLAGNRFGDIASMRRQLLLIGSAPALELAEMLPPPQVIAFSGHMIDRPDRVSPRFPMGLEARVAAALRDTLAKLGPSIGYAQAACGSDILFLEAMQDSGYQTQIVLPFPPASFIETSVGFAGKHWIERFERALDRATRVMHATDEPFLGDDVLFEHAANLIQGMAFLRAKELSTQPLLLTVKERGAPEWVGGTGATARNWTRRGGRIENIDPTALRIMDPENRRAESSPAASAPIAPRATARTLNSLLFADISGYTRMPEQYTPQFAQMFLGTCKAILDSLEYRPVHANTHGDGLFLVFDRPSQAAEFAVRLQRATSAFDWTTLGLSAATGARIALHTGPLFRTFDPVTDRFTYYGTHVNRAARLEPVVQPRNIFVTEEFAASLVAEGQDRFTCDYIGSMPLAKQFGDARLYRLRVADQH